MTPEELYWQDKLTAMTQETIRYYDEKFKQEAQRVHPLLEAIHPDEKKHFIHRINSAWRRVESFMSWEQFVNISSIYLEMELYGDSEVENLTDNILAYVHFLLEEAGVEVTKIRNGMRVKAQNATPEVRETVMKLIINERLLDNPSKEDIKLQIFNTIAG